MVTIRGEVANSLLIAWVNYKRTSLNASLIWCSVNIMVKEYWD